MTTPASKSRRGPSENAMEVGQHLESLRYALRDIDATLQLILLALAVISCCAVAAIVWFWAKG